MDLAYTYDLDLKVEDGEFQLQDNGESTTINAFFTDDRYAEQRGYWLDILKTDLWRYDQSRLLSNTVADIQEVATNIANKLVEQGIYDKLDATVSVDGMYIILFLNGYNDNKSVFNRKFRI